MYPNSELKHHGVLGQRWGVRRTPEQLGHKERLERAEKKFKKAQKRAQRKGRRIQKKGERKLKTYQKMGERTLLMDTYNKKGRKVVRKYNKKAIKKIGKMNKKAYKRFISELEDMANDEHAEYMEKIAAGYKDISDPSLNTRALIRATERQYRGR